jgi:hypothetical protein
VETKMKGTPTFLHLLFSLLLNFVPVRGSLPILEESFKLTASDGQAYDKFGHSVSMSGNLVAVGAYAANSFQGNVYLFDATQNFTQVAEINGPTPSASFGFSVSLNGNYLLVGSPNDYPNGVMNAGSATVFVINGTVWTQQFQLIAYDVTANVSCGYAVAISGQFAAVGCPFATVQTGNQGEIYMYTRTGSFWGFANKLTPLTLNGKFGSAVAIDGSTFVGGAHEDATSQAFYAGQAFVYTFQTSTSSWISQTSLSATNPVTFAAFARSLGLSGNLLASGVPGDFVRNLSAVGSVYVFQGSNSQWSVALYTTPNDASAGDQFGNAVAIQGSTLVVAAPYQTGPNNSTEQGSGYLYVFQSGGWNLVAKLYASDGAPFDLFGTSISISGNYVAVGVQYHTVGIKPHQGTVYVYNISNYTQPVSGSSSSHQAKSSNTALIIGLVVGLVGAFLIILAIVIIIFWKKSSYAIQHSDRE